MSSDAMLHFILQRLSRKQLRELYEELNPNDQSRVLGLWTAKEFIEQIELSVVREYKRI